jgi:protein transport protein SEC61 subunit gamma-like protein
MAADKREFLKISQAVGVGFVVMGAIGYVVKLIHIPVNQVLVG